MHTSIIEVGLEGARDERERTCGVEENLGGEGAPCHLHLCRPVCRYIEYLSYHVCERMHTDSVCFSEQVIRVSGRKRSAAVYYDCRRVSASTRGERVRPS